jgi:hypothetical protein
LKPGKTRQLLFHGYKTARQAQRENNTSDDPCHPFSNRYKYGGLGSDERLAHAAYSALLTLTSPSPQ